MNFADSKRAFVEAWGVMASSWGITRSVSQVYSLLLINGEFLSADDLMHELHMSRGSVNMVLHTLMDYELVFKVLKKGERREFFRAEANLWVAMEKLMKYQKRKQVDAFIQLMNEIPVDANGSEKEKNMAKVMADMYSISQAMGTLVNILPKMNLPMDREVNSGKVINIQTA